MTFGERLRKIRKERGYTQCKLSEIVGIRQCVLCWYETDKIQPTLERIEWLCKALEVSSTELLGF